MTEREYIEQMEVLEARKCTHPLMPTLRLGWSKANAMYLRHVLNSMPPDETDGKAEQPFSLKVLYVRKSKLFGRRASLSNKMCDLPDDAEFDKKRAKFSDEIQAVQRDIEDVMREIASIEGGEIPGNRNNSEKPELPINEAALLRRLASLRASRSRQRGIEKTAKGKKLEKCRLELKRFEKLITDVETALAQNFK